MKFINWTLAYNLYLNETFFLTKSIVMMRGKPPHPEYRKRAITQQLSEKYVVTKTKNTVL